jgi:AraC-like DNA-binding protein
MYVSISIVRAIVDELKKQGLDAGALCARLEVASSELAESTSRLPIDRYDRILRAARAISSTPALGLRVGTSAPVGALPVVGFILTTCGTIREAFEHFLHYSPLIKEGARWRIVEEGEHARFVYEHDVIASDNAPFDAEATLAVVLKTGRQFIDEDQHPDVVRFRHSAPAYAAEYERVFGAKVLFDQPRTEMIFPRRYLDLEQAHGDERLRATLEERAEELLVRRNSRSAFVGHLRDVLRLEVQSGMPRATRLAARMGLTVRSLERIVRDEGSSLSALMEDARRDAACAALRSSRASIKEVAYRFGFSEPSAFHRAFKRWTGLTPAQYRALQTAVTDDVA